MPKKKKRVTKKRAVNKNTFRLAGLNIPIKGRLRYNSKEWKALKKHCEQRDGGKICTKRRTKECFGAMHLHHKTPLSKGGTNRPINLGWICHYHHCFEHPFMIKELIKKVYG